MKKEDKKLVLENEEDETRLYDMCDSYIFWFNEEDKEMFEDYSRIRHLITEETGFEFPTEIPHILIAFTGREEHFINLWEDILKCLVIAGFVKIGFER